jgi:heptaprenyl diphosphate synthase
VSSIAKSGDLLSLVQVDMQRVEELMRSQADNRHPDLDAAFRHLLSSGGKRVRPAVALLMGGIFGGDQERMVTLAAPYRYPGP